MGDYTIKDIYQGGASSLDPTKSYESVFTGYNIAAGELGAPAKADTANQIQQVNMLLNQGIIPVEVGALDPRFFEQIPKQHFKEINRMAKLAGGKVSLHAPIVEPTGIGERSWSERARIAAEKQLMEAVTRSHDMDEQGGMPITMHSTGLSGVEYGITADGKKIQKLTIINQETGEIHSLEEEKLYSPYPKAKIKEGVSDKIAMAIINKEIPPQEAQKYLEEAPTSDGEEYTPEMRLRSRNHTDWNNSIKALIFNKERADEILQKNKVQIDHLLPAIREGKISEKDLTPTQVQVLTHYKNAENYLDDIDQNVRIIFHKAYKYGNEGDREKLETFKDNFQKALEVDAKMNSGYSTISGQSQALQGLMENLQAVQPKVYVPIEEFALEKASETFSNVALKGYEEFGDKAPTVSIENMFGGMAFGLSKQGEGPPGMNELIVATKNKFAEKVMASKGISQSEAEAQADKVIGMTFDVGHLNIAKKLGYTDEDLRKEAAAIAKHVKHVHLTDNFGFSDSHLPPGMGNVPFKELLGELEKAGTLKDTRKIVEAPGWPQHFGTSPLSITYAGMGAPMTTESGSPTWAQSPGLYQGYFGGFGMMLPQINYQTFGAGFSTLPQELGGSFPGQQGNRFGGTPME
tara:strand:+ start:397 stop:2298 length:1902 start_codon:yes stop_codon:yes gene_type:complete